MRTMLVLFLLSSCAASLPPPEHHHRMPSSVACTSWVDRVTPAHQAVLNDLVATRDHRTQHALWHAVRSGLDQQQTADVLTAFGSDWGREHALCPSPRNDATAATYNPAGEDFLYMHRTMLGMVRAAWMAQGLPCVTGWDSVPDPADWPLPPGSTDGPKSDDSLALFRSWDENLKDPSWLKTVSLSELGFALEFTIHNNLHMRYAEDRPAPQFRAADPDDDGAVLPYDGDFPAGWKFDDPAYNWLADPYGAAVNPIFWKIHGYVDQFIDRWLAANGYRTIAENCQGAAGCYQWRGRWVGELSPPRTPPRMGAPPHRGPGVPWQPSPEDLRFHHARLAQQRLGVVGEESRPGRAPGPVGAPHGPMGGPAPAPVDVLSTARSSVCDGK